MMNEIESVPVIDASRSSHPSTLRVIDRACREWGFFQVVRHGIEDDLIDALKREMRRFFASPPEAKRRLERTEENPWGFYDRELTKNTRDAKEIFDAGPGWDRRHPTPWPEGAPEFRRTLLAYTARCERLGFVLLSAISRNLGMGAGHLRKLYEPSHTSFLRLNHYPVRPESDRSLREANGQGGPLGVHPHTDAGALTLLLQDEVPGLEVEHDGRWRAVEPRRDALVVNLGDIVQVWSNDRYRAALHRVRASTGRARYSAPFFLNPARDAYYAPLPTTVDGRTPARYRPIGWAEFRRLRAAGDYSDRGVEVQIDHYRTTTEELHAHPEEEMTDGLH
jgi:isopenicillin N synthase-like dioxygenase